MRAATPGAGVQGATASGFVTYTPSFTEIAIVIGAISFCCFLYLAAEKFLNLNE
jgi:molybdopterin-containing oxidoreductase family membrane subunit